MLEHVQFTIDSGVQVYFCDPKSPWQRGSNENTNGLLRQYFPRRSDMGSLTQERLDAVAAELNGRTRQTLDWHSPAERWPTRHAPRFGTVALRQLNELAEATRAALERDTRAGPTSTLPVQTERRRR
jgi:hypothetical protein